MLNFYYNQFNTQKHHLKIKTEQIKIKYIRKERRLPTADRNLLRESSSLQRCCNINLLSCRVYCKFEMFRVN